MFGFLRARLQSRQRKRSRPFLRRAGAEGRRAPGWPPGRGDLVAVSRPVFGGLPGLASEASEGLPALGRPRSVPELRGTGQDSADRKPRGRMEAESRGAECGPLPPASCVATRII